MRLLIVGAGGHGGIVGLEAVVPMPDYTMWYLQPLVICAAVPTR
jgi:hypothetical protein